MIKGIHHITAIASDANKTNHFYTHILGLRLVKKTVNQDDTKTYHLFFGDKVGHPGMDLTFFIFQPAMQGRRGNGLVTNISLSVPFSSLDFWKRRLDHFKVKNEGIVEKFGTKLITFYDADDQKLELVGVSEEDLETNDNVWTTRDITLDHAIRNFDSASLSVHSKLLVEPILLHVFGYTLVDTHKNTTLYSLEGSKRANFLEVTEDPHLPMGINAAGTVHHIAFRAKDEKEQANLREQVIDLGISTTEVIDRYYFKSVYFRTPAGILFEIATDEPGFTTDESVDELGLKLALPPFIERQRQFIEQNLPSLDKVVDF